MANGIRTFWSAWLAHLALTGACVSALAVHATYRVPAGPLVLILPWLGIAAIIVSTLMLIVSLLPSPGTRSAPRLFDRVETRSFWIAMALVPISLATAAYANRPWVAAIILGIGASAFAGSVLTVARRMMVEGTVTLADVLRRLRNVGLAGVGVFLVWTTVVFVNGALDRSPAVDHQSDVLAVTAGVAGTGLGDLLPYTHVYLRSWRIEGYAEPLVLAPPEQRRIWVGEPVLVSVHAGRLGIPWVSAVTRDEVRHERQVLATYPGAFGPLKRLIQVALERRQWDDALALSRRYVELYPKDSDEPQFVAGYLTLAGRHADAIELLRDSVSRRPDYNGLCMLGHGLHLAGDHEAAIAVLGRAVRLNPHAFLALHFLGEAYQALDHREEAIRAYEAELVVRPQSLEVRRRVKALRNSLQQH